jgi:hypothetical protein
MFANQETTQDLVLPLLDDPSNSGLIDDFTRESVLTEQLGGTHKNILREVVWRAPSVSQDPFIFDQMKSSSHMTNTSLASHLATARSAIAELVEREQRNDRARMYEQALEWLVRNRARYRGQWVALRGSELVASCVNARDLQAHLRGQGPALVVRIELEELPFAGW